MGLSGQEGPAWVSQVRRALRGSLRSGGACVGLSGQEGPAWVSQVRRALRGSLRVLKLCIELLHLPSSQELRFGRMELR